MIGRLRALAFLAAVGGTLAPGPSAAAPAQGGSLAELRAQIDAVAAELESERAAARDEIAALRAERAELERQVRAEQTRAATLQALRGEATKRAEALDVESTRWRAPTKAALEVARAYVERTLPFAKAERLATLARLERDLDAATPDYARAVERLLRFIEEEEAMGREVALLQHRLEFEGEEQIVDMIRLGMALLYIRTADGRYGWAYPALDGWQVEALTEPGLVAVIEQRFAAHDDNRGLGPAELVLPQEIPQ